MPESPNTAHVPAPFSPHVTVPPARGWLRDAWADRPRSLSVSVEGATINVRLWNGERHDLPGVMLVHGFRAHARWWDHIAPLLATGHRVAALDLSGMGDSAHRVSYSRAQHGREILAAAHACCFIRPTVIGHSYGGIVSLIACRATPELVTRAILIDSALPTKAELDHGITVQPRRTYDSLAEGMARFRLIPPGEWPDAEILEYVARHALRQTPAGWTWKFDPEMATALNRETSFRMDMLGAQLPCAFVYGALSEVVTPAREQQIGLMMPWAGPPIVVPASHHHVLIEQPLALVAVLRTLLSVMPPQAGRA